MTGWVRSCLKPADAGHKKRSLHFMNRLWVWAIVALVPIGIVVSAAWTPRVAPGATGTPLEGVAHQSPRPVGMPLGMAGCSAAACHGAPAEAMLTSGPTPDAWRCAATFWFAADPHTQAYAALESELAGKIMTRMTLPGEAVKKATEDSRCLACHTSPSLAKPDTPFPTLRAEGVGCEACHGNSSGWLHSHTKPGEAYAQAGMAKLNDLGERAMVCMGCHVGAPADPVKDYPVRDMNHDMIAAGHPRLNFDFADYQRRLPPHWQEGDRDPNFEVKAWLIGRMAHADAACRLLEDRAERARVNDSRTPWPEFSEYKCVSCHHALGKGYPSEPKGTPPKLGAPDWQDVWPVTDRTSFEILLSKLSASEAGTPALHRLHQTIEKTLPKMEQSRKAASEASAELRQVWERLERVPASHIHDALLGPFKEISEHRIKSLDRDLTEQLYHALTAQQRTRQQRAIQEKQPVQPPEAFESLRNCLQVPRGNLSFNISPSARADLKELLRKE